jgi:L-alanine-DL-glutamate epimerase-like enolase superfamily enzyme
MSARPLVGASARLLHVPLRRPWGEDVREIGVIVVDVVGADGTVGHGFSWTPTIGARSVLAMLEDHILPFVLAAGDDDPERIWDPAWVPIHEAGGGGVTTIALAGADLALWDLRARRRGLGLPELLGRVHDRQPAYGSGVNLHYPLDELVAQVERWVAAGFRGVKIKVGKPDLDEDVERLAAVRAVLGPDRLLMIDANQRWDLDHAVRAASALARFDLAWLEEPLRADDIAAHRLLRAATDVPLALGENLHTIHRFREALDAGVVDVVQPNIIRVGGITPFLRIARLAAERGVRLAPHLLPELSAQLAFALPAETWVEDVEDAGFDDLGALIAPSGITIRDGWATGGPHLGIGMRFADGPRRPDASSSAGA